jgi:hypothetical protein
MSWVRFLIALLSQLVELQQYGRGLAVGCGLLLMLLAILCGSMALMVFGGAVAVFAAFWPRGKA